VTRTQKLILHLGYGNEETIWLDEMLISAGKEAQEAQIQQSQGPCSPIKEKPAAELGSDWEVGMECRAVFSVDGMEYEGVIDNITDTDGKRYATVRFIGYDDVDSVWLEDVLKSHGAEAGDAQMKAAIPGDSTPTVDSPEETVDKKPEEPVAQQPEPAFKITTAEPERPVATVLDKKNTPQPLIHKEPLAVEPAQWKVGDRCRTVCSFDKKEHEAIIVQFNPRDNTNVPNFNTKVRVKFLELDIKEVKTLGELKQSFIEDDIKNVEQASPEVPAQPKTQAIVEQASPEVPAQPKTQVIVEQASREVSARPKTMAIVEQASPEVPAQPKIQAIVEQVTPEVPAKPKTRAIVEEASPEVPAQPKTQAIVEQASPKLPAQPKKLTVVEQATPTKVPVQPKKMTIRSVIENLSCNGTAEVLSPPIPTITYPSESITVINNNSGDSKDLMKVASMLSQELESTKVIADLRKKFEESERVRLRLEDNNNIQQMIIQEMRQVNLHLKAENERYKKIEDKYLAEQAELLANVKTLVAKVIY
jgi:hypothetical protein